MRRKAFHYKSWVFEKNFTDAELAMKVNTYIAGFDSPLGSSIESDLAKACCYCYAKLLLEKKREPGLSAEVFPMICLTVRVQERMKAAGMSPIYAEKIRAAVGRWLEASTMTAVGNARIFLQHYPHTILYLCRGFVAALFGTTDLKYNAFEGRPQSYESTHSLKCPTKS